MTFTFGIVFDTIIYRVPFTQVGIGTGGNLLTDAPFAPVQIICGLLQPTELRGEILFS